VQYTGADVNNVWTPALTLYNYAVSGAVCSNLESPRTFGTIHAPFPDLDLYEVPAFFADKNFTNSTTNQPYFTPALTASNAVYAIFDGTNDIGNYAYFTDSQVPGNTLVSYLDCIYNQVDRLYASGGRFFVLLNVFPLDLAPMYANASAGGVGANKYWPDEPSNLTAISQKMNEYVNLVNSVYQFRTPYEVVIANRYPGANFALFDVHSLVCLSGAPYSHPILSQIISIQTSQANRKTSFSPSLDNKHLYQPKHLPQRQRALERNQFRQPMHNQRHQLRAE
jgi:hypothetical protein